jgi:hypothetical protein
MAVYRAVVAGENEPPGARAAGGVFLVAVAAHAQGVEDGLDVAGIDFLAPDITQPVRETGGAIVEVNAAPGFRMHTNPTEGEAQFVAKDVVDLLFPSGTPSRIPIVAVTGSNEDTPHDAYIIGHGPFGRHDDDRRHLHR